VSALPSWPAAAAFSNSGNVSILTKFARMGSSTDSRRSSVADQDGDSAAIPFRGFFDFRFCAAGSRRPAGAVFGILSLRPAQGLVYAAELWMIGDWVTGGSLQRL
jgi:hypothetical protein